MRIAIIGAGRMGTAHMRAYLGLGDVEVAAIVGRRPERARAVSEELGVPALTDVDRVLADKAIDAIDLTVPSAAHRDYAVRALEAGKHVLCETPMTLTLEDADAIVTAHATSGSEELF